MSAHAAAGGIQAILLDIEGTTTPIAFVVEVLFPYARMHLRRHLEQHAASPEYLSLVDRLRHERAADRSAGESVPSWVDAPPAARLDSAVRYIEWLMDRDRKSTTLKTLQGNIWEEGYRRSELAGEVFDDVPLAFERWHARRWQIAIFSSGSVLAQQLLFRHSTAGDLTRFLHWYFDTTIGGKTDRESYRRIADTIAVSPSEVLFISDVTRELDAAGQAGMRPRLAVRPGNAPAPGHSFPIVSSFDEL